MAADAGLGFGLGLRPNHYDEILETHPEVDWFEIITENFLVKGGKPLYFLDKISEQYPIVMHGVSMSLGSLDPLDMDYLHQVKNLAKRCDAKIISDHLCWTGVHGKNMHDLIPLPYTEQAALHVAERIKQVQDFLEQPLLIENVSSYVTYKASTLTEWAFIETIVKESGCSLLVDINNIYVSAFNHGFDAKTYLNQLPKDKVKQFHLAGHTHCGTHIIDTHDHEIVADVWDLYRYAITRFGHVPTLIERDDNIPPLEELLKELTYARQIASQVCEPA